MMVAVETQEGATHGGGVSSRPVEKRRADVDPGERLRERQIELGQKVRKMLVDRGFPSVAAPGFEAPCVVVSYTTRTDIVPRFAKAGAQVAAGVPLMCGEPADYRAFRIGLFGLDKLYDVDATVARLEQSLVRAVA